ncbi:MAG: hypothetical protein LBG43_10585 [Treponema sp.]|nr:hypothetical protein [Treponema sp.]
MSNTWLRENFVALSGEREVFAYFEGQWSRPMDIITGFSKYLEYLFVNRGCQAFNWTARFKTNTRLGSMNGLYAIIAGIKRESGITRRRVIRERLAI